MRIIIMHNFHPTILRAGDIRGIYGETLFDADAEAIGKGFATAVIEIPASKRR